MTDQELLDLYVKEANNLSYYNAADGASFRQEAVARNACKTRFQEVARQVIDRGLELPKGDFLI